MTEEYYAHSRLDGKPPSEWQPLEEHLINVAKIARSFAESFDAGIWAYLAGLWHYVGNIRNHAISLLYPMKLLHLLE